jgi:isopentenyl diphosphate isomerase/L-lactate dehydrogenase-like FMN-dependent dehydrogenase
MASGVDDDATLRANRAIFARVQLRPRRLHDSTVVDTRVELFGTVYNSPIFLCPTGGEGSFFPDGEAVVARAAARRGTLQCLSTMTGTQSRRSTKRWAGPLVSAVRAEPVGRVRTDAAARRSRGIAGGAAHGGQHHRPQQ